VGGSGGFISVLTIIAEIAPLALRPILLVRDTDPCRVFTNAAQGSFGAVFGIAGVVGPIVGGMYTVT
jgi:hypothetical protein